MKKRLFSLRLLEQENTGLNCLTRGNLSRARVELLARLNLKIKLDSSHYTWYLTIINGSGGE